MSKDQLERASLVSALDYVLRYERDNIKRVGNEYRLRDHPSLSVGDKGFYWHSRGFGSKTALDFMTGVRGYSLVDAVCLLLNEQPHDRMYTSKPEVKPFKSQQPKAPERQLFAIPRHNGNNNRVVAYLQSRGIDKESIMACISRGDLHESALRHECVFKGKDRLGKTRYAAIRSTTTAYKGDTEGSDKRFCFLLPPANPSSDTAAIFESPIDCLSHHTMCKQGFIPHFDGWRLSLGGTSILGLEHFLNNNPQIAHCLTLTDNDEAGNKAAARIAEIPGITTERALPPTGTDWNDALLALQRVERVQQRAHGRNNDERG